MTATITVDRDLADRARAAQVWAQRAKLGQEQVNLAAVAKLWAERRAGELLREVPSLGKGGDRRSQETSSDTRLGDLGVTKHESSRWQRLAGIPQEQFAQIDDGGGSDTVGLSHPTGRAARKQPPGGVQWVRRELQHAHSDVRHTMRLGRGIPGRRLQSPLLAPGRASLRRCAR